MSGLAASTVDALRLAAMTDPTRPAITYYDDATGERTELSGATVANWVAKTANLLVDGHALGHGDTAVVLLPAHWQSAAVLLGCWSAGLAVDGAVGSAMSGAAAGEIAFATTDLIDDGLAAAPEVYGLGLAPLAAPMRPGPPAGVSDYVVQVRGYGDRFASVVKAQDAATPTETHAQLCERARRRAAELGIPAGGRVLLDADAVADPVDWLLAPLAVGASTVLCRHLDPGRLADRVAAERVRVTLPR